jgi:hypothetical protein
MQSSLKIVLSLQDSLVLLVSPSLHQDLTPHPTKSNYNGGKLNKNDFYER